MLKIRLRRVGKTKKPYYRMVVADNPDRRDGDFIEPWLVRSAYRSADCDAERGAHEGMISKGAQPSEAAAKILKRAGIIEG